VTRRPDRPRAERLTPAEVRALMRCSFNQPIPPPPSLMQMARRRRDLTGVDQQDNETKETA
jgi:hypothetical protein